MDETEILETLSDEYGLEFSSIEDLIDSITGIDNYPNYGMIGDRDCDDSGIYVGTNDERTEIVHMSYASQETIF